MPTLRRVREFWTEAKRVTVDASGEPVVKQTTCCCEAPAASRRDCSLKAGNKTPCRCFCHSKKPFP